MPETEITLQGRESIEAYISEDGLICMQQESALGDDRNVIMILPSEIPQIVDCLQHLANEFCQQPI